MTRWLRRRKRGAKFLNPSSLILPLSIIIKPSLLRKTLGLKPLFDGAFREAVKSQIGLSIPSRLVELYHDSATP